MLSFLRFIRGFYRIKISGYSPERFFNLCRINGIILWDIVPVEDYFECRIRRGDYKKIDAFVAVGDFANSGTENQMRKFKEIVEKNLKPETQYALTMASHEYHSEGVEAAHEKFARVFDTPVDQHRIINGFHFISITCSQSCNFHADKIAFAAKELKKAREADPKKPIFVFQHPHITDTVYGSMLWGEDELYATYMDYPQIINFSGHSHAPINNPRSIHQKHFTSLGTGSLSYTELDEFDKYYGTVPPMKHNFAQFLIVEADKDGRVRIYPYDIFTDNFFPYIWEIDEPWNPESFKYTDDIRFNGERLKGEEKVYIVMNKPKGYVTTASDPHADKTVMDLLKGCPTRVFPVGRLDKNTTGVLMFTNDGEIAEKLTHPSYDKKKIYQVSLDSKLRKEDFDKILSGVELNDGMIAADELEYIEEDDHRKLGIEIHSGKNRIVRRIFESLGYEVKALDRVYFAGLTKKGLKRGEWRYLSEGETNLLKMGAYL